MNFLSIKFLLLIFLFTFSSTLSFAISEVGTSSSTASGRGTSAMHSQQVAQRFVDQCTSRGVSENFCRDATNPNQDSRGTFNRVYGKGTPFVLMPGQEKWETGIYLLGIAESLSKYGKVCEIRNWFRPEPYNRAVDGARSSRHIDGSAIDIEFCSPKEKNKALKAALAMRQKFGAPPGVGVYGEGSHVIHIDMSNRIYGPGIGSIDNAVSRDKIFFNSLERPGTNLRSGRASASVGSQNSGQGFWRELMAFFFGK